MKEVVATFYNFVQHSISTCSKLLQVLTPLIRIVDFFLNNIVNTLSIITEGNLIFDHIADKLLRFFFGISFFNQRIKDDFIRVKDNTFHDFIVS